MHICHPKTHMIHIMYIKHRLYVKDLNLEVWMTNALIHDIQPSEKLYLKSTIKRRNWPTVVVTITVLP